MLLRLEACGLCHSDLFVAGLEKLPLAPLTLGHEGIGRVEAAGPGVTDWSAGRSRRHHLSRHHLRGLRVVRFRPRALLPQADQFRLHPAGRARRVRHRPRRAPWCACPSACPPPRPRRCAAPAGPPTAPCAKPRSRPASRWRCSDTAGWATWRCNSRCTRDCKPAVADPSPEKLAAAEAAGSLASRRRAGRGCRHRLHRRSRRDSAGVQGAAPQRHAGPGGALRQPTTNCRWWTPCSKASRFAAATWARARTSPASSPWPARASCAPTSTRTRSTKRPPCWIPCGAASFRGGP